MLLEAIVAGLCLGGWECSKAPQAYYISNRDFRSRVEMLEYRGKKIVGPNGELAVAFAGQLGMLAGGRSVRYKIDRSWSADVTLRGEPKVSLEWALEF